jgi:4-carboxymuconolactone decarboxylase
MLRRVLRLISVGGVACLLIVAVLTAERFAAAQQKRSVAVPPGALPLGPSDTDRFTGLSRGLEPNEMRMRHRWFEPGARTAWHRHAAGQLFFVEKGRGRIQKRGQPMREMAAGESEYTPPGVEHWHGAAPNEELFQVTIGFGEQTDWLEKVTDAQYAGR